MATAGIGTTFGKRAAGSSVVYTPIAEITDIQGPSMSKETLETTTVDTTGGYRTFMVGLKDAGAITLTMNYTKTAYAAMLAGFQSDVASNYQIKLPDNTTITFDAFVTEMPLSVPVGLVTFNATIKISGAVTCVFPS